MTNNILLQKEIESRIYTIRGTKVMLDRDLAEMYEVETKVLNQSVKRNIERFPESFRFQVSEYALNELNLNTEQPSRLRSQIVTSSTHGGRRYLPYAYTEQGVAMLSAVLRSKTAVKVSIQIINAFVEMRKLILDHSALFQRLDKVELKQIEADKKFERIFSALEKPAKNPDKGIFFDGQVYDAYIFCANLIKKARKSLVLIDNYVDDTVLTLLSKRNKKVAATIYTVHISKQLALDLKKHNTQYPTIEVKILTGAHDRFLLIDEEELYHMGSSIKDLGKKWFAFSRMDGFIKEILQRLR
jgi:phage regulator Rha-like protein